MMPTSQSLECKYHSLDTGAENDIELWSKSTFIATLLPRAVIEDVSMARSIRRFLLLQSLLFNICGRIFSWQFWGFSDDRLVLPSPIASRCGHVLFCGVGKCAIDLGCRWVCVRVTSDDFFLFMFSFEHRFLITLCKAQQLHGLTV